jgi:hypothetical protein
MASNSDSNDDEDLFMSLGGSLMKDLLADLQVDDGDTGWLSLEQLEQELSQLDVGSSIHSAVPPTLPSVPEQQTAASIVLGRQQHQQKQEQQQQYQQPHQQQQPMAAANKDAWSLSLERFTAASLGQDFLMADTARKQQQTALPVSMPPGMDFSAAEDYDIAETLQFQPPPGIVTAAAADSAKDDAILQEAAAKLVQQMKLPPMPRNIPRPAPATPQNSMSVGPDGKIIPPTPPPSKHSTPMVVKSTVRGRQQQQQTMIVPSLPVMAPPLQQPVPPPQQQQQTMPPTAVPMAVPLPNRTAWQSPPRPATNAPMATPIMTPPHPVRRPVYANPHPRAPAIPAEQLQGRYMKSRDISYVVHAIMRPILNAGVSQQDYDVQFLQRRVGPAAAANMATPPPRQRKPKSEETSPGSTVAVETEIASRSKKAKEWSSDNAVLGYVAKTNVTRPRALLADNHVFILNTGDGSDVDQERKRASLWKARIYCDQAYQAFTAVQEHWRLPDQAQHFVKLLKCLGVTRDADAYKVDATALPLLLKLNKGKVLVARLLEQAMLPPATVHALLPAIMQVLYSNMQDMSQQDLTDDRMFAAIARIVQTLPNLEGKVILQCVRRVQANTDTALQSVARMHTVHALLQRGGAVAAGDKEAAFAQEWSKTETEFMKVLGGM